MSLKKYIAEFIGTFFLVLTICMIAFSKVSADLQPLAIGMMLTALIYAKGHISGALFNPAISFALLLRGKMTIKESVIYAIVQILGAVAAAFVTGVLISGRPPMTPFVSSPQFFAVVPALLSEILGTFILAWVILNVATSKALEGNEFYGIAIGFAVSGLIYTLGSVSFSVFNPAVAIGLCIAQLSNWANLWIYIVGTLIGGALAAVVYRFLNKEE